MKIRLLLFCVFVFVFTSCTPKSPWPKALIQEPAEVHMQPESKSYSRDKVTKDLSVYVMAKNQDESWYRVRTGDGKIHGWVPSKIVKLTNSKEQDKILLEEKNQIVRINGELVKNKNGGFRIVKNTTSTPSPTVNINNPYSSANLNNTNKKTFYAGYSKKFTDVKYNLYAGDDKAIKSYLKQRSKKSDYLRSLEKANLSLMTGDFDSAISDFDRSEGMLDDWKRRSLTGAAASKGASFFSKSILGISEAGGYRGEPYEHILSLNLKAIAHLMKGERKSYNVARRMIDWQNLQRDAYLKNRKQVSDEISQGYSKVGNNAVGSQNKSLESQLGSYYNSVDRLKLPSAYVNPFGFYLSGLIQEVESRKDPSLISNAHISYKKALELNPRSEVLKKAVNDTKQTSSLNKSKRFLSVIVADGFVPEKKVLSYNFQVDNQSLRVNLPVSEVVNNEVAKIVLQDMKGRPLSTLSTVADVEALCLRHQKDEYPKDVLTALSQVAVQIVQNEAANENAYVGLGIALGRRLLQGSDGDMPDTRSWMSLPSRLMSSRVYIPQDLKKVKLLTYNQGNKLLSEKIIDLNQKGDLVVYARTFSDKIYAHLSDELWLTKIPKDET